MSGPRITQPSRVPLNIIKPSQVNLGGVKMNEMPTYVQTTAIHTYSLSIPQEYTVPFLEHNMALLKGIKVLRSLIAAQTITFRAAAVAKLAQQINDQCAAVYAIMTTFLNTYSRMCVEYICPEVIITNIKEVTKFLESLKTCYGDFLKLVEKIKDKTVKKTWQDALKITKIVPATGHGDISILLLKMVIHGIVYPIVECAATIVTKEKVLKSHIRISRYSLVKGAELLKSLKSKTEEELPKILALCKSGVIKTSNQIAIEEDKAKKKKNNKQLLNLAELRSEIIEIESHMQMVEVALSGAMDEAEQALKNAKYGAGDNVEILINLKTILKKMVGFAKEVFVILEDPKNTSKQRITKINLIIKKIAVNKNDIETTVTKITWTKKEDEVGQHTTKVRMSINKVSQKFAKLNSSSYVRNLYKITLQWSKAKPNAFVAFVTKYGKYIIMALGFIVSAI